MDDDWDVEDSPAASGTSTPAPVLPPKPAARSKWQGEDEEEEQDDWDASEDEKPKAKSTTTAAPAKKKMTLKQKLAEKEKLASEAKENGVEDDLINPLTEQERRRLAREREIEADLAVAADLLGSTGVDDGPETLKAVLSSKPTTKSDFAELSKQIISAITSRHESNPLYSAFVEQFSKDLCENLSAVQTRKVSSALSVLGNTKQQEERDKASGKKKTATKPKAALGSLKTVNKVDTEAYDDVLEDDDFM